MLPRKSKMNESPNKGVQRTLHKVSGPLTPDVQRENMKTICIPYLCVLCTLLVGCSTTKIVKTDGMRSIIITQASDTQYCLQASETLQVIHLADGQRPREVSSKTDTLNYLKVCATVGGDTETAEVKTPSGEIATSVSLALREEQGSLIATYELKKMLSDGTMNSESGEIKVK